MCPGPNCYLLWYLVLIYWANQSVGSLGWVKISMAVEKGPSTCGPWWGTHKPVGESIQSLERASFLVDYPHIIYILCGSGPRTSMVDGLWRD